MQTLKIKDEAYDVLHATLLEGGLKDELYALKQEALKIAYAKIAKYDAECSVFRHKHRICFSEARMKSKEKGKEDFELDDDYLDWRFAHEALIKWQLRKEEIENV
jgi:hypothetical protein